MKERENSESAGTPWCRASDLLWVTFITGNGFPEETLWSSEKQERLEALLREKYRLDPDESAQVPGKAIKYLPHEKAVLVLGVKIGRAYAGLKTPTPLNTIILAELILHENLRTEDMKRDLL